MRYALCRFKGDGLTWQTAFKPDIPDGEPFDMIDLRPDPTVVDGVALVALYERVLPLGAQYDAINLGNSRDEEPGPVVRSLLANRLGFALDGADTAPDAIGVRIHTVLGALAYRIMLNRDKIVPEQGNIHALCLGNERIFERAIPSGGMTVSTDNFNRADSTTLGSPWAEDSGDLEISSNGLRVVSGGEGGENIGIYDVDCGSGDMYTQVDINFTGSYGNAGVIARSNSAHTSRFEYRVNQNTLNCQVVKYVSSSYSEVRAGSAGEFGTWTSGVATMKATAEGNNHAILHDGVSKVTFTDSDNTTLQRGGVWIGYIDSYTAWVMDNYEQGKLNEGGPFTKLWGGVPFALSGTKGRW